LNLELSPLKLNSIPIETGRLLSQSSDLVVTSGVSEWLSNLIDDYKPVELPSNLKLTPNTMMSAFVNAFRKLKQDNDEKLAKTVDQLKDEFNEKLSNLQQPRSIQVDEMIELYPGSMADGFKVDKDLLERACKGKGKSGLDYYYKKIFSSLVKVADLYR